ncbi:MAG: DUF5702 domain-containing protein [Clostridia bacterium]|nr:DUF5702 domain-containing protein [Clostridia bacterium]
MKEFFDMLNPYTNKRVKGAITILLLILMTPFVTIAFALLELGRYENTITQLDEAMGVSTMALLANYDKYLQDRFGLYACTQSQDLNSLYKVYMDENLNGLRFSMKAIKGTSVTGVYSLGDSDVLRKQIDEYMMLNGPQTLINEVFDLSSLLSCFSNISGLEKAEKCLNNGIKTANDAIDMAEAADEMKDLADGITNLIPTYNSDYTNLKNSVDAYLTKAATPRPTDPPASASDDDKKAVATQQADYDKALATLAATVNSKKSTYSSTIQSIIDKLEAYNKQIEDLTKAKNDFVTDAGAFTSDIAANYSATANKAREDQINAQLKTMTDENAQEYIDLQAELQRLKDQDAEYKTASNYINANITAAASMAQVGDGLDSAVITTRINSLKALKTTVDSLDVTTLTSSLSDSTYHGVTIDGYLTSTELDDYFDNQANDIARSSIISFFKGIGGFFKSMIKCTGLFDPAQCATIDVSYYSGKWANYTYPSTEVTIETILDDISYIFETCEALEDDLSYLPNHPIKFIINFFGDLIEVINAILDTISDLLKFAGVISDRIAYVIDHPVSVLNAGCYAGYNMSCRTGGPLIGKMDNKAKPTPGVISGSCIPGVSDLAALIRSLGSSLVGGTEYSFYGCELEYILFGSYSEIGNQVSAFGALYILRLLLDVIPICTDEEVAMMAAPAAAAFGVGELVVYLVICFVEPLIDTLLLVNSAKVPLIKTTIYLTPAGIPELITAFISVSLTSAEKNSLISDAYDAFEVDEADRQAITDAHVTQPSLNGFEKWANGFLNLNYRDYLFVYLILMTATDPMGVYRRIANVVLMEENQYYKNAYGEDASFELDKAYTFVETTANISVNPLLSDTYSDYSIFTIDRAIYRGY